MPLPLFTPSLSHRSRLHRTLSCTLPSAIHGPLPVTSLAFARLCPVLVLLPTDSTACLFTFLCPSVSRPCSASSVPIPCCRAPSTVLTGAMIFVGLVIMLHIYGRFTA